MLFGVQWYYWAILVFMIILAIFAWSKALKASKDRRERLKKEAEIWKRDYELREEFRVLTEDKITNTPDSRLLHGVAMNIQIKLEAETDMNASFLSLPREKQFIYALEYFDEDAKTSLSTFYKNNGAPLTPIIRAALDNIGYTEILPFADKIYPMYDEDSDVSIDYDAIALTDNEFKEFFDSNKLCDLVALYIRKNKEIFLS